MQQEDIFKSHVSMPIQVVRSAAWKALTASARIVFQTMSIKCKPGIDLNEQYVHWLQDELADEAGLSLRTTKTCIKQLAMRRWIEIASPGSRWTSGSTYRLILAGPHHIKGQPPQAKQRTLYLYVIEVDGFHKIGTTRRPRQRFKKYVTENPHPVSVLLMIPISTQSVETICHEMLSGKHHRSEWYKLDESDLAQVRILARG